MSLVTTKVAKLYVSELYAVSLRTLLLSLIFTYVDKAVLEMRGFRIPNTVILILVELSSAELYITRIVLSALLIV